jgi:hypothetical protein
MECVKHWSLLVPQHRIEMELDGKYSKDQSLKCDCLLFGMYTVYTASSLHAHAVMLINQSHKHKSVNNLYYLSYYLLDLDDTLYPFNSGIAADIMKNIQGIHMQLALVSYHSPSPLLLLVLQGVNHCCCMLMRLCSSDYMVHKLGVEESISLELCVLLYKQYGTTMAGLRVRSLQSQNKTISSHFISLLLLLLFSCCFLALILINIASCYLVCSVNNRLLGTSLITMTTTGTGLCPDLIFFSR